MLKVQISFWKEVVISCLLNSANVYVGCPEASTALNVKGFSIKLVAEPRDVYCLMPNFCQANLEDSKEQLSQQRQKVKFFLNS